MHSFTPYIPAFIWEHTSIYNRDFWFVFTSSWMEYLFSHYLFHLLSGFFLKKEQFFESCTSWDRWNFSRVPQYNPCLDAYKRSQCVEDNRCVKFNFLDRQKLVLCSTLEGITIFDLGPIIRELILYWWVRPDIGSSN